MNKMPSPCFSVIISCYNEGDHIQAFLREIYSFFTNEKKGFELLCINDGSIDQTRIELEKFKNDHPLHCKIINYEINRGQGCAFRDALALAEGKYVFWLPSDGEISPEELRPLLEHASQDTLVISYPVDGLKHRSFFRYLLSQLYQTILRIIFRLPFRYFNAMTIYPLEIVTKIPFHSQRFFFPAEILIRTYKTQKLKYIEIPFKLKKRQSGKSSAIRLCVLWEILKDLFLLYRKL